MIALCVAQTICGAWLLHSQRVERQLRPGVVVSEDVPLTPCTGVADPLQLPEGLELRIMRQRPDGRLEVRLRNGRRGCLRPEAIYEG